MSETGTSGTTLWRGVWVYAEQRGGAVLDAGFEMMSVAGELASRLGATVSALVIGHGVEGCSKELIARGAGEVYLADHPALDQYDPDAFAAIVVDLVQVQRPQILLVPATGFGRDLAPTVAARLGTGLCADCTALDLDGEGRLLQIAPVLGGKDLATMLCPVARPQMATVRPGVFPRLPADYSRRGQVLRVDCSRPLEQRRMTSLGLLPHQAPGKPLPQAEVVVAGGAGVAGADGWRLLADLAGLLGAEIGGTRPPVDDGFLREDQMIGQSGVTIRPKLYFAIGISGDIQHTVGFAAANIVVAINKDPAAPIFKVADYGIVGDYRQVVPVLIEELRRR